MISQRFKVKVPLIVLLEIDGLYTTRYSAIGDVVTITNGPLDGTRMVEVQWQGKPALMFTMELREHAELLPNTPPPS